MNLMLLVIGSTPEEIRANAMALVNEALEDHRIHGDKANAILPTQDGNDWLGEYEFTSVTTMSDWILDK